MFGSDDTINPPLLDFTPDTKGRPSQLFCDEQRPFYMQRPRTRSKRPGLISLMIGSLLRRIAGKKAPQQSHERAAAARPVSASSNKCTFRSRKIRPVIKKQDENVAVVNTIQL